MIDLLPCPSCGRPFANDPDFEIGWQNDFGTWHISCGGCGLTTGSRKTQGEAIVAWNMRPVCENNGAAKEAVELWNHLPCAEPGAIVSEAGQIGWREVSSLAPAAGWRHLDRSPEDHA